MHDSVTSGKEGGGSTSPRKLKNRVKNSAEKDQLRQRCRFAHVAGREAGKICCCSCYNMVSLSVIRKRGVGLLDFHREGCGFVFSPGRPVFFTSPESSSLSSPDVPQRSENPRFKDLRGVQWRINLGSLPPSSSSSTDDLRRVSADCRRRYAGVRGRLLVDPHPQKDGSNSPDLAIDIQSVVTDKG